MIDFIIGTFRGLWESGAWKYLAYMAGTYFVVKFFFYVVDSIWVSFNPRGRGKGI